MHPQYAHLHSDTTTDITIIGAGITGLTAAMLLRQAGRSVVVIEMNRVASGTTGHSTGHLDTASDQMFHHLISKFNRDKVAQMVRSRAEAIDLIERWDRELNLDADVRRIDGWLYAEPDQDVKELEEEIEAAASVGLAVERHDRAPLPFPTTLAMRVPRQGRMDPLRYVTRLAAAFVEAGGQIHEDTRMLEIEENGRCTVTTDRGTIHCDTVLACGHAAIEGFITVDTRNQPWQSYVIAARVADAVPDAIYWDMTEPYHYTRLARSGDPQTLIVGGADHRTGSRTDTTECLGTLTRYLEERYRVIELSHRWSHQFFEPVDGMPYIGRVPWSDRTFIATGFSGEGLTFGTVAGRLLADLALQRDNVLADLYTPMRLKPLASFARQAAVAAHAIKGLIVDRVRGSEVESIDDIRPGHGALVQINGKQLAVHRDDAGAVHALSPVCNHMGCIVHWNDAERTWDCPCHGGRYDATGRVVTGPPRTDLQQKDLETAPES